MLELLLQQPACHFLPPRLPNYVYDEHALNSNLLRKHYQHENPYRD
jgi:hypothetical protein